MGAISESQQSSLSEGFQEAQQSLWQVPGPLPFVAVFPLFLSCRVPENREWVEQEEPRTLQEWLGGCEAGDAGLGGTGDF